MHFVVTRDVQGLAADVVKLWASSMAPENVGNSVPPEVLMRGIRNLVERLKESRRNANERQQATINNMLDDVCIADEE